MLTTTLCSPEIVYSRGDQISTVLARGGGGGIGHSSPNPRRTLENPASPYVYTQHMVRLTLVCFPITVMKGRRFAPRRAAHIASRGRNCIFGVVMLDDSLQAAKRIQGRNGRARQHERDAFWDRRDRAVALRSLMTPSPGLARAQLAVQQEYRTAQYMASVCISPRRGRLNEDAHLIHTYVKK